MPGPKQDRTKPVWRAARAVIDRSISLDEAAHEFGLRSTGAISKYVTKLRDEAAALHARKDLR